jgi:hypothetical protein
VQGCEVESHEGTRVRRLPGGWRPSLAERVGSWEKNKQTMNWGNTLSLRSGHLSYILVGNHLCYKLHGQFEYTTYYHTHFYETNKVHILMCAQRSITHKPTN